MEAGALFPSMPVSLDLVDLAHVDSYFQSVSFEEVCNSPPFSKTEFWTECQCWCNACRSSALWEELSIEVDELPTAGHQARTILAGRGPDDCSPPGNSGKQVTNDSPATNFGAVSIRSRKFSLNPGGG